MDARLVNTDHDWEHWGERDPYYGVLTDPRYRAGRLDDATKGEFFLSGQAYCDYLISLIRSRIDRHFKPARVMDFGCGVGRVLIPLARECATAVGVDVSPSMLQEARRNCDAFGITNVELALSDDGLLNVSGDFDLVHSCIVFQHIDPSRGNRLFDRVVSRLKQSGVGAIQVTFGDVRYAPDFGQRPSLGTAHRQPSSGWARVLNRRKVRAGGVPGATKESAAGDPEMLMFTYNLSQLFFILKQRGVQRMHVEMTDHGGALGALLVFTRDQSAPPSLVLT
jgi:SAM-dependent methyltransferase